ncbi:unnamed protein product [Linum tenue]|uniref:BHLH domain-containing protein n=2 Tax=Linum tenue TaxID=586396 RepID=A0AAV0JJR9_9ROSI|nr:unnamed protein product [Linum tenue]
MGSGKMESFVKEKLRGLCCSNNGWSFGLLWRFDHRNSMLLRLEDAFYEEQMKTVVEDLLPQVHMVGEGMVGETAFCGKHKWISWDADDSGWCDSEITRLISSGVKTICMIPLGSQGVIQLGSKHKISERQEFVDQTKRLFSDMEKAECIVPMTTSTASSLTYDAASSDLSDWFASFCSGTISPIHGGNCDELVEFGCTSSNFTQSSVPTSCVEQERIVPSFMDASRERASSESRGKLDCNSTWSNEGSILTSLESQLASEIEVCNFPWMLSSSGSTPMSHGNLQGNATLAPCYNTGGLMDVDKSTQAYAERSVMKNEFSTVIKLEEQETLCEFPEEFKQDDLSNFFMLEDPFEWIPCSQSNNTNVINPQIEANLSQSVSFRAPASGLLEDICSELRKPGVSIAAHSDMFKILDLKSVDGQVGNGENSMAHLVSGTQPGTSKDDSKFHPTLNGNSKQKGLFSELGLEELLGGLKSSSFASARSSIIDEGLLPPTKRRKMENSSSLSVNQLHLGNVSCSASSSTSMLSASSLDKAKSPIALLIEDSFSSINTRGGIPGKDKKPNDPAKKVGVKKRARPGESTRPRPKDRQQIQDRLKELRGIVPNAEKDSIDNLLDRTIRHMCFLQSVAKYADQLKQVDKPKVISTGEGGCGATWALEVGDETVVCPVIVKDLVPPGLMLVEILCKDQGYFLEIAEAVRGFGLNILKGVMEAQDDKIWARFVIEASSSMTRADVLWSLVPLLPQNASSGMDQNLSSNVAVSRSYQQPGALACPIGMAETTQ